MPDPAPISVDDVRHVARLARLAIADDQAGAIVRDLNTILQHVAVLSRVDTTGVREHVAVEAGMPLRADHGPPTPLAARPEAFAPPGGMRDGFFVVPRLATHEDAAS